MSDRAAIQVHPSRTVGTQHVSTTVLIGQGIDARAVFLIHLGLHPFTGLPQELFPQLGVLIPSASLTLVRVLVKFLFSADDMVLTP
jgi:hypothetical protein